MPLAVSIGKAVGTAQRKGAHEEAAGSAPRGYVARVEYAPSPGHLAWILCVWTMRSGSRDARTTPTKCFPAAGVSKVSEFAVSDVPTGRFAMAPLLGNGHPDDAAETADVAAARRDLHDLQLIARSTRESVGRVLAAPPAWLDADAQTVLASIHNMCNVLVGPAGRALRSLHRTDADT